jgi:tetratricopeptide (TPR) repeat protein
MSETAFVTLCLETLAMGAVQSYVDIMYLAAEGSLTMRQLGEVRQELVAAEQGRRHGDAGKVSAALVALSGRFRALGKMKIAVFFLERLLEVARVTADVPSEMRAHNELGEAHECLGSDDTTLLHHNAHRALATSSGDETEKALACSNLVRVYSKQARREEEAGNHERALQLFLSALEAGESTGDVVAEADTCYGAGRSYLMNGQAAAAVPLLQQYVSATFSQGSRRREAGRQHSSH